MERVKHKIEELPLEKLRSAPWNYKTQDAAMMTKLKRNMERNGQVETIIVRPLGEGYEVVNGNHRLEAMQELGWDSAQCLVVENLSDEGAHRLAIETNETRFALDELKLAELVDGMQGEFSLQELSETMPFSDASLESLVHSLQYEGPPSEDAPRPTFTKAPVYTIKTKGPNPKFEKRLRDLVAEYDDLSLTTR